MAQINSNMYYKMAGESWSAHAWSVAVGFVQKMCPWATPEYVNEQCVHVIEANTDLRHDVEELMLLVGKNNENMHQVCDTLAALEKRLAALEKLVTCQDELKALSVPAFATAFASTLYKDAARNFFNKPETN